MIVHALWGLEGSQELLSLFLCGEALHFFAELRMEKALVLDIIAFLIIILHKTVRLWWLKKGFSNPVNCRLMLELRPHKMR